MTKLTRLALALAALAPAACELPDSATSLNPEGPPMIQQVFMQEPDAQGRNQAVLAFGTHDLVPAERTHAVTKAAPLGQTMRVVFDELLIGNYLEEVACNARTGVVDCPQYSHIPEGATPEDIARCADADPAALENLCKGEFSVCMNPERVPCGIKDEDTAARPADGAPDDLRVIAGVVSLRCGNIEIGFDQQASFWQPAGNQLVPAGASPENSLGPALVLHPLNDQLPTNQTDCHLVLSPTVVDKDHIKVCAPAGGTLEGACTPGDLTAFSFSTEPLISVASVPSAGQMGVATELKITIYTNALIDEPSLRAGVTLRENGVVRNDIAVAVEGNPRSQIAIGAPDGADPGTDIDSLILLPNTSYEVSVTPRDTFGVPAPTPITFTFTTGQ